MHSTTRVDVAWGDAEQLFPGESEMAARCRAFHWAATPLGPVDGWPQSLRTTVATVLATRFPMILLWGPDLIQIYNDAYIPFLGVKHPWGLGIPTSVCWSEAWHVTEPISARVLAGESLTFADQRYPLQRRGPDAPPDDVFITSSWAPVRAESGGVGGVLIIAIDSTAEVTSRAAMSELATSEARYRVAADAERRAARLVEQTNDQHAAMDRDFRVIAMNSAAERGLGVRREDVIGRSHWEVWPASVGSELERQYRRVVEEGVDVHFRHHYTGEGYDLHLETDAYPTEAGGIAVFWRDITARVRAAEALERQAALTRVVADNATAGLFMLDRDGHPTYMNSAAVAMTGYALHEIAGLPLHYAIHHHHPDGTPYPMSECPIDRALPENRPVRGHEDVFVRRDGSFFPVECAASPIMEGDVAAGTVVEVRDVTRETAAAASLHELNDVLAMQNHQLVDQALELELVNQQLQENTVELEMQAAELQAAAVELAERTTQAEEATAALRTSESALRALADAIPTLAWTAQSNGYIDWYNARWFEFTGTTPADMAGWGWQSVHDPAVLPAVLERWTDSIASGRPFEMTFPLLGADGAFRQFLTRVVPVRGDDGAVRRWFGTNTDVDAEHRARAEAEAARQEAEAANRAKGEFLAVMSHELRTPLNAIGGYAELMEMGIHGTITAEQQHALERIQRSQRHLLGLINGVLNYTRVEAGAVHYELEDVPLDEVLVTCEALTAPQVRAKRLDFRHGDCDPTLAVHADREKLQQVVLNLLSNAVKFTEPGGRVEVRCARVADGVTVRVSDTGRGIAPTQLDRVFQPFVQVDAKLTRTQEGVGLGLAISRDLARGMGGDLTVESVLGEGSTFTLTLPKSRES